MGQQVQGHRRRIHDIVIPFGLLFFAAFVYFSVWGWRSIGPAQAFRSGAPCAATAPISASCRTDGTATVTGTFAHSMPGSHGGTRYGITYTGHGRVPNASVTYTWGTGRSPLPTKNAQVDVTLWQGTPIHLTFGKTTVAVNTAPDADPSLIAAFADIAALGAVCVSLLGRPLPYTRKAMAALRAIDWVWLPGLIAGYGFVALHFYVPGFVLIDAAGGLAFVISQALRVRLVFTQSRNGVSVGDDPKSPPSPGLQAERERKRRSTDNCPVPQAEQHWIEFELTALLSRFDIDVHNHPAVVPAPDFYPVAYDGQALEVRELSRKLCGTMGVDPETVRVRLVAESADRASAARARYEPYSGHFSAGTQDQESGLCVIDLDDWLAGEPPVLSAVIAHELAHIRLRDGNDEEVAGQRLEQQADLLTIAYGLGLFGANVSFHAQRRLTGTGSTSLGHLDHDMYGYALACYAWLRDEREPKWAKALGPVPRACLAQGLRFLATSAGGGGLPSVTEARSR